LPGARTLLMVRGAERMIRKKPAPQLMRGG
jgi:hypothetical protein